MNYKETYPLTLDHVKQFLATKQDNDVVGECFNAMHCLLSEVLNWLYPEQSPWRVDIGSYSAPSIPAPSLSIDLPVEQLRIIFDRHTLKPWSDVTKYVFLTLLEDYDLNLYTQLTSTMPEHPQSNGEPHLTV